MSHIATIETKVAGIPCLIGVISYSKVRGSYNEPSSTETDWELLDRKGYKATWLERKMNDQISNKLEDQISDFFEGE